jgi:hypothetical protein
MKVTIDLPEDVSAALSGRWDDVPRRSLETIAGEGYRIAALTGDSGSPAPKFRPSPTTWISENARPSHSPQRYTPTCC